MMKRVLVTGTSRPFHRRAMWAARLVATTLAEREFSLITGDKTGVEKAVAAAFCMEVQKLGGTNVQDRYTQFRLPWHHRTTWWERRFSPPSGTMAPAVRDFRTWLTEARRSADAAVIVGGHRGTLAVANRFIEAGKPVFPIPFTGGGSNELFQEMLRNWCDSPVPHLSHSQFLRLAVPWVTGTGVLAELLRGALAETEDVFISYRREESQWLVERLRHDLAEHFGEKRVFQDLRGIHTGEEWRKRIEAAIASCRVGIVVIDTTWLDGKGPRRLDDEDDVLRKEVRQLLTKKTVIVVTTLEAPVHQLNLPSDLSKLLEFQAITVSPTTWDLMLEQIVRTVRRGLRPTVSTGA